MPAPPPKVRSHRYFQPSAYISSFLPTPGQKPPLEYQWRGSRQDHLLHQIIRRRRSVLAIETDALPREEIQTIMLRSWKIGSAFGIGVHIHPTFWLLPLIFAIHEMNRGFEFV